MVCKLKELRLGSSFKSEFELNLFKNGFSFLNKCGLDKIKPVKILIPIIHRWPYQQNLVYIVMMSTQHYMNNGGKPVRHYLMLDIYFIYK